MHLSFRPTGVGTGGKFSTDPSFKPLGAETRGGFSKISDLDLQVWEVVANSKQAVREYANVPNSYILSLKYLKYFFCQRSTVARATLQKVKRHFL